MHLSRLFGISLLLTHGCTDSPADTPPPSDGSGSGSGAGEEGTGTGGDDTGEGSGDDTGQATPYEWPAGATVLANVHIVDGLTDRPDAALVIVSDEIWDIVDADSAARWPDGAEVLDYSGKTLIPGLIDAHVHIFHSGSSSWVGDTLSANLQAQLAWGVVGIADLGAPPEVFTLRDRIAAGELWGPRIWATGPMITTPGSHPCELVDDPNLCLFVEGDGAEQAATLSEADGLKVVLADADFTTSPTPRLDLADLTDIVATADAAGQPVWAHVDEQEDVDDALSAGVDVMAHPVFGAEVETTRDVAVISTRGAFSGTPDLLSGDLMAEDLSWTPSEVRAAWAWLESHPSVFSDDWVEGSEEWLAHAEANVAVAIAEGRTVLAGSDAGYWYVPHGVALHRELAALVDAGMSPQEALAAATSVPADALGWDDLGHLAAGYRADFVVLDANPLDDIDHTREISELWLAGAVHDPATATRVSGDPADEGAFCLEAADCTEDCDLVTHRCGEDCPETYDRTDDCGSEAWCSPVDGLDATTDGVCQTVETCDLYDQDCTPDYYGENCVPVDTDTSRCWPAGPKVAGESCSWSDPDHYCQQGDFCSWITYRCYELCDPADPNACSGCTLQLVEGQPWFGLCL